MFVLRSCGLALAMALLIVACGGGGGSGGGNAVGAVSARHDLQYSVGAGEVATPYGPYPPTVTGTVTGYSVSPALTAGLRLDLTSGVISGTPRAASSGTYIVAASNEAGATTAALILRVLVPPAALTYTSPVTGTVGAALTQLVPTLSGDADGFAIEPMLPDGVMFDPMTGIVSGTPSRARVAVTYIVTASNVGGAYTQADLVLAVDPPAAGTVMTGVFRTFATTRAGALIEVRGRLPRVPV